jgi:uncharacterized protein YlxP (DUF503 family)
MAFVVGICTIDLIIPASNSLKDKRSVLKSMLNGMRNRFNVSAAEVDHMDLWRRATIGLACVSNSQTFVDQVLNRAVDWVEQNPEVNVANVEIEFL